MSSDRFTCASLKTLFDWVSEYDEKGEIFGIASELFFIPSDNDKFRMNRYGQMIETPLGVAAGPHSQLSQNIISAWLTGARYMELKTIQVLDELEVTKPCIDMSDEGYNCEWSQELKLHQSLDEYLNAWIFIHILRDKFKLPSDSNGFIFNMSVGYNLEGIMSTSVQTFLDKMEDCTKELKDKIAEIEKFYPRIKNIKIPSSITRNITISTMHGCPPEEVEKIGRYFIEERKLDTTIKLNPTLLGADKLREILNDKLGFDVVVPDLAFEHDLKYEAGVALIKSLTEVAEKAGVVFNLKLTNTLETSNIKQKLPKNEEMVYMSGRALHPISINVAYMLQKEFDGKLDLSFSAGADCFNIADILKCGLKPVTICSDILKPGGYGRISQYLDNINEALEASGASDLDDFVLKTSGKETISKARIANLKAYAELVTDKEYYKKTEYPYDSIKTLRKLELFDCAEAPCMTGCPAGQEIPRYLEYTARGDFEKAYQTILATNPFPNVQGKVCDHMCMSKCTRINYERPLLIREIKRYIADKYDDTKLTPAPSNGISVSIIGAGPSGLSCAHFLALEGFNVEVYEAKSFLGGMASDGIPVFRLDDGSLAKDIDNILSLGVKVYKNTPITSEIFEKLRENSDYVYVAIGAQQSMPLRIEGIDADGVYDQLTFLSKVRQNTNIDTGQKIIVIGAGNSAMDAARTAKRLVGKDGEVTIVYRRTRREMPCNPEEVRGALEEGIKLIELASPEEIVSSNGKATGLKVSKMKLGEPDEGGRARPIKIENSEYVIEATAIIPAIGQQVVLDFFPADELQVNTETYETQIQNIYAGGDAYRGASSLIHAIADGQKVADQIIAKAKIDNLNLLSPEDDRQPDFKAIQIMQARRNFGAPLPEVTADDRINFNLFMNTLSDESAKQEAERCLQCDLVCNICTTVCPNRSNVSYQMEEEAIPVEMVTDEGDIYLTGVKEISQPYQVLNIGDYCNECGNCTIFCPSAGRPFVDKPKFHLTKESYDNANIGFYYLDDKTMLIKRETDTAVLKESGDTFQYSGSKITATMYTDSLRAKDVLVKIETSADIDISFVAEYITLYKTVKKIAPFRNR